MYDFSYTSYQTLKADANGHTVLAGISVKPNEEYKLHHHLVGKVDDDNMEFSAKHVGDSVNDLPMKPFDAPIDITIPESMDVRLNAGDEASDVSFEPRLAWAFQQFKIWLSGQVSIKEAEMSPVDAAKAIALLPSGKEQIRAEIILAEGNAKAKKALVAQLQKLLGR